MAESERFRDLSIPIKLIGLAALLVGLAAAAIGPLEIYTFYLFEEGGRFHFDGFGFGSLMFGNITVQVLGYYFIALLGIALGYGHVRMRRCTRKITLTLLWDWLALGLPLSIVATLMLLTSKDLPPSSLPVLIVGFLLLYPVSPVLLILLYRSRSVRLTFRHRGSGSEQTEDIPQLVLVTASLMVAFAIALHVPLLFSGVFPLFGRFLYGLQGFQGLDLCIILFASLAWGTLRRKRWAWWGSLVALAALAVSAVMSLLAVTPQEIIANMRFAPIESEALSSVPVQGYHLAVAVALPLVVTLVLLVSSRRHYWECR